MKFISDGTWFDKLTEVSILSEHCTVYDINGNPTLQVLVAGTRNGNRDEELCTMDEFIAVGEDYEPPQNNS